ncbi:MAG: TRAP transporter small permease, partial [Syntrophales bacterium LBB04]|nr:TRAP transporter small permease [Syntrophales bacterium LBB04]
MNRAYRIIGLVSEWLNWCGVAALIVMILLICVDVILRAFGTGILGAYEITRFFVALMVGLGLAYTQLKKGHIFMDLLLLRLPKPVQNVINTVNLFLAAGFYALVTLQLMKFGGKLLRTGQVAEQIEWPLFPFVYTVAFGCLILFL